MDRDTAGGQGHDRMEQDAYECWCTAAVRIEGIDQAVQAKEGPKVAAWESGESNHRGMVRQLRQYGWLSPQYRRRPSDADGECQGRAETRGHARAFGSSDEPPGSSRPLPRVLI